MPLTFEPFNCHSKDVVQQQVMNWCNNEPVTRFMATGRIWVNMEDAVAIWGGRQSFFVRSGEWWELSPIGVVGLFDLDTMSEKAELRIMLGECRGAGLGTQAVEHILRYGFKALGLWRIYLGTAVENEAAVRCFHKCGFQDEGLLVDDLKRDGKRMTNVRMAILRPAWEERHQ